jgi:EF-P beta-lysylation protein EpmB
MTEAISDPAELLRLLDLEYLITSIPQHLSEFRLKVPMAFIQRMRKGDPDDPLLKQVLPLEVENEPFPGFGHDPVGDLEALAVPGLLHKYAGRALLTVTGACGIHCRYCFRRHFPYAESNPARGDWAGVLEYLQKDEEINEIILSGGDPLVLTDSRLSALVEQLEGIPQLQRLRLHTRMPVIIPDRVNNDLLEWLSQTRFDTVMVIHINHASEIDSSLLNSLKILKNSGVQLLNQAVLLKGINDTLTTQTELSEALFHGGVLPYYLHLLDRVQGAAHFEVSEEVALNLYEALRRRLPGYLLPRMVREISGHPYKTPALFPNEL